MATTNSVPVSGSWNNNLKSFLFDAARAKYIDVATKTDANNIPDRVDVATGNAAGQSKDATGGLKNFVTSKKGAIELAGLGIGLIVIALVIKKMMG